MVRRFAVRLAPALLAVLALSSLSGCGAILNGTSSQIPVTSSPDGAQVLVTFRFPDGREQIVPVGRDVNGGYIVLDVLVAGILGIVVDAVTGGWSEPEVDPLHGAPPPKSPPAPGAAVAAAP